MVSLLVALTIVAEDSGPVLTSTGCYSVINPTEQPKGILLRESTEEFRKLTRLKQLEPNVVEEPFAPMGTPKWFGQILGLLPRQRYRIEIGKPERLDANPTPDSKIATAVVNRLSEAKRSGKLKGFNVEMNIDNGTVWLSGKVANKEQKDLVLDIARRIKGVKQVVDDLTITERSKDSP